jgi:hypothetical protein
MAIGSGISAQISWSIETTPGTIVAPTVFNPLVSESLAIDRARLESAGIIAGRRVMTSDQWNGGNITAGGDIGLELYNKNLGKLFRGIMGAVNTTGSNPYDHVFTPGDLSDDVLTVQVGLPGVGGTVHPKTLGGCAVASWEMAGTAGEIVTLGATLAAMNGHLGSRTAADGTTTNLSTTVTSAANAAFTQGDVGKPISGTGIPAGAYITAVASATSCTISAAATASATVTITIGTALASASYASSQKPVKFHQGALSLFGSSSNVNCKSFTLAGDNALADDRFVAGSRNRLLPIEAGLREYTCQLELEFYDLTQWDRYAAGTEGALSLVFTIPGTTDTVTVAGNIRYDAETPQVGDRSILTQNCNAKFIASGADSTALTITLVNSDSAA